MLPVNISARGPVLSRDPREIGLGLDSALLPENTVPADQVEVGLVDKDGSLDTFTGTVKINGNDFTDLNFFIKNRGLRREGDGLIGGEYKARPGAQRFVGRRGWQDFKMISVFSSARLEGDMRTDDQSSEVVHPGGADLRLDQPEGGLLAKDQFGPGVKQDMGGDGFPLVVG